MFLLGQGFRRWLVGWLERRWFEANGESVMIEGWKGGEGRGLIDDEPWIFGCARFCGIERREMNIFRGRARLLLLQWTISSWFENTNPPPRFSDSIILSVR